MNTKIIDSVLDVEYESSKEITIIENSQELVPTEESTVGLNQDQKEDYKFSRKTFRELVKTGSQAIEDLAELADSSSEPRAYEVLATLMKSVSDITKDLYDLQTKTRVLQQNSGRPMDQTQVTNIDKAVFVGSTSDLLKKLKSEEDHSLEDQ